MGFEERLPVEVRGRLLWDTAAIISMSRTRITVTYFSNEYADLFAGAVGGAEGFHRKVGWPSPLMIASKMLSLKTERNRLRAFSNLSPICGLSSPSVDLPGGGRRKSQL